MTATRRTAAGFAAAAALALPLAGCGKEKPKIPRSDARDLVALLKTVQRQTDAHACVTVKRTIASLSARVETLPAKTDPDIRSSLRDGLNNLEVLVQANCSGTKPKPKQQTTETQTQSTESQPTTTETTTNTQPTTTETTNTQTTNTQTTNTQTTPPTTPSGGTPSGQPKNGGNGK